MYLSGINVNVMCFRTALRKTTKKMNEGLLPLKQTPTNQ